MNKLTEANKIRIEQLIPQTHLDQSDMQFMVEQYIWVLKGENNDKYEIDKYLESLKQRIQSIQNVYDSIEYQKRNLI